MNDKGYVSNVKLLANSKSDCSPVQLFILGIVVHIYGIAYCMV